MNEYIPTIDEEIDASHLAAERAETDARAVMARIRMIPGTEAFCSRNRGYGMILNPWETGTESLTVQALITRKDPALAQYLAGKAGKALRATSDEELDRQRRRDESIRAMQAKTEAMRNRNQAVRAQHEHEARFGRWNHLEGRWV